MSGLETMARTEDSSSGTGSEASNGLIVGVVLSAQVGGRVFCELICDSRAAYTPISSLRVESTENWQLRTKDGNEVPRVSEDAHGSDILLA